MIDAEKLILCVQTRPCIWDIYDVDYYDREKKDLAWIDIFHIFNPNWETLCEEQRKIKIAELKKKWGNCRDYYLKDEEKLKGFKGSAPKKSKRYVHADILSFLDKIKKNERNNKKNYETDDTDEEDEDEEQWDVRTHREQEDIKTEYIHIMDSNTYEESKAKQAIPQAVPADILKILKMKKNTATKDYDDDEKYLLSFLGDMKKMTHMQKIDFKLGMMQLLKNIFTENSDNYYIKSNTPSPQSSYR
ncbi:uncharacterized protein LOC123691875 [Colias croceus]|uniref:uncharacterized protein LOC123691875 n=1 Tax=Colias crocea TaxID=72248 RepID=UPI001E27B21A|nr:uncharacterized protein LOC123691875 [Colias croceus]